MEPVLLKDFLPPWPSNPKAPYPPPIFWPSAGTYTYMVLLMLKILSTSAQICMTHVHSWANDLAKTSSVNSTHSVIEFLFLVKSKLERYLAKIQPIQVLYFVKRHNAELKKFDVILENKMYIKVMKNVNNKKWFFI